MASSISQAVLFCVLLFLSIHNAHSALPAEKNTHLHFYFHELTSGSNATTVQVVYAPNATGFAFGSITVIDDLLKEGKDDNSTLIGRAQGLVIASGMDGSMSTMLNLVFTEGAFNGSTLALYGRLVLGVTVERPIIGGTGAFRMARGYSLATPITISATEYVYEFDIYVWHI